MIAKVSNYWSKLPLEEDRTTYVTALSLSHYYFPFVYVTFKINVAVFPTTYLITSTVYAET